MPPDSEQQLPFLTRKDLKFEQATSFSLKLRMTGPAGFKVGIQGFTREGSFNFSTVIATTGVSQSETFRIPDIPILISVIEIAGSLEQGNIYAELTLLTNDTQTYALCSGLVYKNKSISYPATSNQDQIPNRGIIGSAFSITDPAAGAQFTYTFPVGYKNKIIGLRARLITSATVATRRVGFATVFTGNNRNFIFSKVDQTANQNIVYQGSIQAGQTAVILGTIGVEIPSEAWAIAGATFVSFCDNMQVGDQWTDIEIIVEGFVFT